MLIGSIRRDRLDHVVEFGERDFRHLLNSYQQYYNEASCYPIFYVLEKSNVACPSLGTAGSLWCNSRALTRLATA